MTNPSIQKAYTEDAVKDKAVKERNLSDYGQIADLFEYPDINYPQRVKEVKNLFERNYPKAAVQINHFLNLLPEDNVLTMQELFTRSFDVQAITTLDIGYVLFGDDYKRGELLSNLNREHNEHGNNCGTELADHLPNMLRLMARLTDEELITEMVDQLLVPAIRTMIYEFNPQRIKDKNKSYKKHYKTLLDDPVPQQNGKQIGPKIDQQADQLLVNSLYQHALNALYEVLRQDFSFLEKITPEKTNDFLKSIISEGEIEESANKMY